MLYHAAYDAYPVPHVDDSAVDKNALAIEWLSYQAEHLRDETVNTMWWLERGFLNEYLRNLNDNSDIPHKIIGNEAPQSSNPIQILSQSPKNHPVKESCTHIMSENLRGFPAC